MTLQISNREARRLWLSHQGLAETPTGALCQGRLMSIIEGLGFVQLDTIRIIARAHDHILWSRNQNYREGMLDQAVKERVAFEHFTHDASVLPMTFYPYWRRQFERMRKRIEDSRWHEFMPPKRECEKVFNRVCDEGPLSTKDFETKADKKKKEGWVRPPHKVALDYYWYAGELATCHRRNFIKHYDTREKIIPAKLLKKKVADRTQINWLCDNALDRLGFASDGDIQRFWDACDLEEVKAWRKRQARKLIEVEITAADGGKHRLCAPEDVEERISSLKSPTSRLRLLNPFDPVIRDRKRLARLFGFDYRVEMFTPAAKRQYGYYIYPMLEGDRFVGRIEAKADRKKGVLNVEKIWWEQGVKQAPARLRKLEAELERMARFVGIGELAWGCKH